MIEKAVSMPQKKHEYPFREMAIGDSFVVSIATAAASRLSSFASNARVQMTTHREGNTSVLWIEWRVG